MQINTPNTWCIAKLHYYIASDSKYRDNIKVAFYVLLPYFSSPFVFHFNLLNLFIAKSLMTSNNIVPNFSWKLTF